MTTRGDLNRARVFEVIHLFEPISRTEIASRLDLTSAAISNIVSDLLDRGFVCQLGRRTTSRGQPSIELGIQADAAYTIGLHFEHGSVAGIVADLKGKELHRKIIKLEPLPSPEIVVDALITIGAELLKNIEFDKIIGVGLASVGPVDLISGSVTHTEFTLNWHKVALRDPLAEAFRLPVFMDNNATAGAIGEYWYGMGRSYENFLYVAFNSMGLGGGLILNKRVYRGSALNAAEFGHMLVAQPSPTQGVPPFLENFVSGHALQRDFGNSILETFEQRLLEGDLALENWLDNASQIFSQALVSVDHLLDLDAIIVGGQLPAPFFETLFHRVERRLSSLYMHGWSRRSSLCLGQIGQGSAVIGAAALPVYDAFSPSPHITDDSGNFLRSVAAGGSMH